MLIIKGFALFIALAPTASAFFPWVPEYRCIEDKTCIVSKDASEAQNDHVADEVSHVSSFKIVQRIPQLEDLPHELRVRRLAERLSKKYSGRATQVKAEGLKQRHGIAKRTNTYAVNTAVDPKQTNSAGIDQDGTDYSYFAQVLLGSAKTPMYMLLDSGAGTSWVMGPSCTSASCKIHNSFGAADSTTFKSLSKTFSVSYGSGSVSGSLGTDTLTFADMTFTATLGIADTTSADFTSFPMDGILGLSQATGDTPNFLQTLVSAKVLKSNLFGVNINRAADGANNGEINFGAPDTSKFTGNLGYTAIASSANGDWAIPMDDLGFDGKVAGITGKLGYIDTGTSYVFAPKDDAASFHKLVPGSSSSDGVTYSVPCTTSGTMEFIFGGVSYSVLAKDWVGGAVGAGQCTSNIYGHEVVSGSWLLGDTFLKNVYTVFDVDGDRIGFAPKSSDSTSRTGASSTGGPTSSSDTKSSSTEFSPISTSLQSSTTVPITTKVPDTVSKTQSDMDPTVSSSTSTVSDSAASTTRMSDSSESTPSPGLNGHETAVSATPTSAASSSSTSAPSESTAKRLDAGHFTKLLGAIALLTVLL